jgi:uncharacterized protein (TIGR03435 family)
VQPAISVLAAGFAFSAMASAAFLDVNGQRRHPILDSGGRSPAWRVDQAAALTAAPVAFEVASIKVNRSGTVPFPMRLQGRTYTAINAPLRHVIATAYEIPAARVLGGPSWLGDAALDMRSIGGDRFDILATLPDGATAREVPAMLRALLAARFALTAHTEHRESPVYALVVRRAEGTLGPRLRRATTECAAIEAAGETPPAAGAGERGPCDAEIGGELVGRGQRLTALARMLTLFAGRPVVDRTALDGAFDFDLDFPELDTPRDQSAGGDVGGGVFTAVEEQLGLKLESSRAPLDFVIVDAVSRPTEN